MLTYLERYVTAYLGYVQRNREKYRWQLAYFDGFAGSGVRHELKNVPILLQHLFSEGLPDDALYGFKGAAERVLGISQFNFDSYYFIDTDRDSNHKLRIKLEKFQTEDGQLTFRADDVNLQLTNFAKTLRTDASLKALVVLDPIGMHISWSTLARLTSLGLDLFIMLPVVSVASCLLDARGVVERYDLLKECLPFSETELRGSITSAPRRQHPTFRGPTTEMVWQNMDSMAELYIKALRDVFDEVAEQSSVLFSSDGYPLAHLVFASNNKNALRMHTEVLEQVTSDDMDI